MQIAGHFSCVDPDSTGFYCFIHAFRGSIEVLADAAKYVSRHANVSQTQAGSNGLVTRPKDTF
ncbi:hypothetical protein DFE_1680 [Desulfovibrio ferrophilus]|uniref:Uncharacterized protein n=1 Tax=Desulfovibrio ferrophilus TaxID=241368 RepID=A0A2Z6AZ22_9BACT|nr:hypothetical protein DFE_1680 [Desulfovibrio ferrophilus]